MKTLTIAEAKGCLAEIIAEVNKGELVILKNGQQEVTLHPGGALDLEQDTPELEAEILKGMEGPFTPYSSKEMRGIGQKIIGNSRKP